MGGPASRPGSRSHAVIWNGKTLLKPMVKKHARLVREFYLFEQRWARMQDFLIPNLQLMRNLYSGSDREGVDLRRILIKK